MAQCSLCRFFLQNNPSTFEESVINFRKFINDRNFNFTDKLSMCVTSDFKAQSSTELTFYDFIYASELVEYIGPIVTLPIISILGFLLNAFTVLVIRHKPNKTKYFKENRIFTYMKLNSIFNAIQCFFSSFTLMNECLGYNSIFCSSIQQNIVVQWFKIIFIQYIGESMKTCSIITLLAFSIERYIQTSESKRVIAIKFQNMNIKVFVTVTLVFSFTGSAMKLLEFSVDSLEQMLVESPRLSITNQMEQLWFQVVFLSH